MRNYFLSLLSCAALLMACQPITPIPVKTKSPSPNLETKDATQIPAASKAPPLPQATSIVSMSAETLSSDPGNQNDNQAGIDLAINTVTKSNETETNSAQESPDIAPKAAPTPTTFDPAKIVGFATLILTQNIGNANMVRKEGPIEVWQYQFESCVVDFFFYPIVPGSSQLVLKVWDMRSKIIGDRLDRGTCSDEINLYREKFVSNS